MEACMKQLELANVRVFKNAKETGRLLGVGSFGCVVELQIKGTGKFAGKKIHEALVADGDTSLLVKECKLMSELIHPNIAKFCGVCKLPSSTVPTLVMELMDQSLEDFLENKVFHIALTTALSMLIDVASGLMYLHTRSPRVLHRDLTARNVLIDRYTNAKITDFGNAMIIDPEKIGKAMTQAPGTSVYMPPEALDPHSTYSDRLDIFSFGHLALYTIIRDFPKILLPSTYIESGGKVVARSELERRSKYMETLNTLLPELDHKLYQLIYRCLENNPTKRPDAKELLSSLQEILCLEYGNLYYSPKQVPETPLPDTTPPTSLDEGKIKTGQIEKRSRILSRLSEKGAWRTHTFTINCETGTFQYTRKGSFPARGPTIKLSDITEIKVLEQDGSRFPFEVHYKGKHSPWELRVYSEDKRNEWKEKLQSSIESSVMASPTTAEKELGSENKDKYQIMDECIYDKIIDVLSLQFNPNQMGQFVRVLQSKNYESLPESIVNQPPTTDSSLPVSPTLPPHESIPTQCPKSPKLPPKPIGCIPQGYELGVPQTNAPSINTPSLVVGPVVPPEAVMHKRASLPEVESSALTKPSLAKALSHQPHFEYYEDMESGPKTPEEILLWTPSLAPPSLPKRRHSFSCESLVALQQEALSISPDSLTNLTKIGGGHFGDVYKAQMGKMIVAVKAIKSFSSRKVREQFENEMSIMSQVSHHNIVKLHGILREGPISPALVMEYLPNGDLKTFLQVEPQSNEFLMKCMSDIAMGMHYLCGRGLIHRDLAARNILLDKHETCKVSDFGLLREVPKDKNVYVAQGDGPSPLRWMAPESITDNIFSTASDVWSYGIVQWEMFFPTKQPYPDMLTTKMIVKVANGYRMPVPRGCPSLAAKIMKACWNEDPNGRPNFLLISNLLSSRDRLQLDD